MAEKVFVRKDSLVENQKGVALLANKCKSCGQIFFPKALFCFSCFNRDMEDLTLSRRGKLYSYTVAHMAAMHFEPPYAIGLIDMPEGIRIFAPLKMMPDKSFRVGEEVEVVIEKLWQEDDREIIGYKFRPV
jgi:uncharacterized OB-fold protein